MCLLRPSVDINALRFASGINVDLANANVKHLRPVIESYNPVHG